MSAAANPTTAAADLRALDQLRARLLQLSTTLGSLRRDLERADPLPPWPALTNALSLLTRQLSAAVAPLSPNPTATLSNTGSSAPSSTAQHQHPSPAALFAAMHIHPLPISPGAIAHEAVLGQLLRKMREPDVVAWVDDASASLRPRVSGGGDAEGTAAKAAAARLQRACDVAARKAGRLARSVEWGSAFTEVERRGTGGVRGVRTGLRRDLAGEEEEDEEDEDEEDEDEDGNAVGEGASKARGRQEQDNSDVVMRDAGATDAAAATAEALASAPMLRLEDVLRWACTGSAGRAAAGGIARVGQLPSAAAPAM